MNRREIPYVVVDVFTRLRYGGNQLAVIPDARSLSDAQMQRIANEFNFSETTFVLPPANPENIARVRIFNRAQEMPFAGHPNVGTGYVLGLEPEVFGVPRSTVLRFEEIAGIVEVQTVVEKNVVHGATITAPQTLTTGNPLAAELIANCLGLGRDDLITGNHQPIPASVGIPFVLVELHPTAMARATPNLEAFRTAARSSGGRCAIFLYARSTQDPFRLRARMFSPLTGTWEDAATGSASAALGAYLAQLTPESDAIYDFHIDQGIEMGRPSEIQVSVPKIGGKVQKPRVTGRCVLTMRGVLTLD